MKRKQHSHPCKFQPNGCTGLVPCDGELARNVDGHPEVICRAFHNADGTTDAQSCYTCEDDRCQICEQVVMFEGHATSCRLHEDNYDGPDDGEAWAGPIARNH